MIQVKETAKASVFRSAGRIVEEALLAAPPAAALPNPVHLKRTVNRVRQALRPEEPRDLDFVVIIWHDTLWYKKA